MRRSKFLTACPAASIAAIAGSLFFVCVPVVMAEQSKAQTFRVTTPESASVATPESTMILNDSSDSSSFPPQRWTLTTSSVHGLAASFAINEPFQHETDTDARFNASLDVQIVTVLGSGQWTSPQSNATTDHQSGVDDAVVTVECEGHGQADVDVVVGFDDAADVQSGRYSTTLFVTLTSL